MSVPVDYKVGFCPPSQVRPKIGDPAIYSVNFHPCSMSYCPVSYCPHTRGVGKVLWFLLLPVHVFSSCSVNNTSTGCPEICIPPLSFATNNLQNRCTVFKKRTSASLSRKKKDSLIANSLKGKSLSLAPS